MRSRALRRTPVVTVVSLALLLTACGGEAKDQTAGDKGKAEAPASSAPAVKALTQGQLDAVIVGQADLKGYQVAEAGSGDLVTGARTDKDACKVIGEAMYYLAPGLAFATAARKVFAVPKGADASVPAEELRGPGTALTMVTLGSYDASNAQDGLAALKKSATECAGGFTVSVFPGEELKVRSVAPMAVSAGDEAAAWTIVSDGDGGDLITNLVVVRKKNTLASFYTYSFGGAKEQPKAVIDAQVAKLG